MNSCCEPADVLKKAEIRPTSNRILVLRALLRAKSPLGLMELESEIQTLERSSIFRVLSLFLEQGVIHTIEDGRGVVKYEICHGQHDGFDSGGIYDMHAHFYCEVCHKVYCFKEITAPRIDIPGSFQVKSVNYMLKGVCPECRNKADS